MPQHLLLRLEAPMMSFGTTAVDHRRPVQPWPATSMLTGLLGNALGWTASQAALLDGLQSRLRWAARIDRPGTPLNDFQTAQLKADDKAWTTRDHIEERGGGENTYNAPHLRYRDYRADASVLVAVRLDPADHTPTLADIHDALNRPARPLFIGRKSCPPATRIAIGIVDAVDAVAALGAGPSPDTDTPNHVAVYFNEGACEQTTDLRVHVTSDERRFALDVHAGRQRVYERPARIAP
jgi:CRISPR system Cascade subunit CasD